MTGLQWLPFAMAIAVIWLGHKAKRPLLGWLAAFLLVGAGLIRWPAVTPFSSTPQALEVPIREIPVRTSVPSSIPYEERMKARLSTLEEESARIRSQNLKEKMQ